MNVGDKVTVRTGKDGKSFATSSGIPSVGDKMLITSGVKKYAHISGSPSVGDKVLTVQGADGRTLGIISGYNPCLIDLSRFALVYGSNWVPPIVASKPAFGYQEFYGDDADVKWFQCGYQYSGHLTGKFYVSNLLVGIIELRVCKNNFQILVIESYGEDTPGLDVSLWYMIKPTDLPIPPYYEYDPYYTNYDCSNNPLYPAAGSGVSYIVSSAGKIGGDNGFPVEYDDLVYSIVDTFVAGTEKEVGMNWIIWRRINYSDTGIVIPYLSSSYNFTRVKNTDITAIDCCSKCIKCNCITCNVDDRFTVDCDYDPKMYQTEIYGHGATFPASYNIPQIHLDFNLIGRYIYMYFFDTNALIRWKIIDVVGNSLVFDKSDVQISHDGSIRFYPVIFLKTSESGSWTHGGGYSYDRVSLSSSNFAEDLPYIHVIFKNIQIDVTVTRVGTPGTPAIDYITLSMQYGSLGYSETTNNSNVASMNLDSYYDANPHPFTGATISDFSLGVLVQYSPGEMSLCNHTITYSFSLGDAICDTDYYLYGTEVSLLGNDHKLTSINKYPVVTVYFAFPEWPPTNLDITRTTYAYGLNHYGNRTLAYETLKVYIEYILRCTKIKIFTFHLFDALTVWPYPIYFRIYYTDDTGTVNLIDTHRFFQERPTKAPPLVTTEYQFDALKNCYPFNATADGTSTVTSDTALISPNLSCEIENKTLYLYTGVVLSYTTKVITFTPPDILIVEDVIATGTYIAKLSSF